MNNSKTRVAVAMSGGVDSSVAAALLVEQGFDVFGIMLRLWSEPGHVETQRDNRCCTRDQMLDAHIVARKLGIPFEVVDARDVFKSLVVDSFIESYSAGDTPNPCLACNRHIRYTHLLNEALTRGATHMATGHYARVKQSRDGAYQLWRGLDESKDQSYVLSVLTQNQLKHAMFPLGELTKPVVREIAMRFGLQVATKSESQDLCFVADGDYRRFMQNVAPASINPGPILSRSGEVLGQHSGLPNYTIGQRKGLGLAWSEPLYVIDKDSTQNTLIVGTRAELGRDKLRAVAVNWIDGIPPADAIRGLVKTRYKAAFAPATITPTEGNAASVVLDEPVLDITPGQGAIFYDGDRVLGGGLIARFEPVTTN
jgi:tRNA-uridine 2-sulfurtransferase